MNSKLIQLFEEYWEDMISTLQGNKLSNPLLIYIKDEEKYQNADIRIMFFGQETNGWYGELGSKGIGELVSLYSDFLDKKYTSHFWNALHDYVNIIKKLNPDKSVEFQTSARGSDREIGLILLTSIEE